MLPREFQISDVPCVLLLLPCPKSRLIPKMESDMASHFLPSDLGPTPAGHRVALVRPGPTESEAQVACSSLLDSTVHFSLNGAELERPRAIPSKRDVTGHDKIDKILIPLVHMKDSPISNEYVGYSHRLSLQKAPRLTAAPNAPYTCTPYRQIAGDAGPQRPIIVHGLAQVNSSAR